MSGSLFSIFGLKHRNTKIGLENYLLLLVTDCSDRYLSLRPVYLNLITHITISIIVNNIQYINSYFQLKYVPPSVHQINSNQNLVDIAPNFQPPPQLHGY